MRNSTHDNWTNAHTRMRTRTHARTHTNSSSDRCDSRVIAGVCVCGEGGGQGHEGDKHSSGWWPRNLSPLHRVATASLGVSMVVLTKVTGIRDHYAKGEGGGSNFFG